ncbi:hypothetical protein [Streptomyces sp. NPDC047046]|uniref:hypothetical protein n=1 Tax=Streptomyces sp. NPDC047046 TaxID=3155378 RepID=UPI0033C56E66
MALQPSSGPRPQPSGARSGTGEAATEEDAGEHQGRDSAPAPVDGGPAVPPPVPGVRPARRPGAEAGQQAPVPSVPQARQPGPGAGGAPAPQPPQGQPRRRGRGAGRRPSGRERHDEKITVYVSAEELMDLEHARLVLRGEHGLAVDRGRIVREAVAVVLADLESRGDASILVRRLRGR